MMVPIFLNISLIVTMTSKFTTFVNVLRVATSVLISAELNGLARQLQTHTEAFDAYASLEESEAFVASEDFDNHVMEILADESSFPDTERNLFALIKTAFILNQMYGSFDTFELVSAIHQDLKGLENWYRSKDSKYRNASYFGNNVLLSDAINAVLENMKERNKVKTDDSLLNILLSMRSV
jgi:hypothetical protein